MTPAPATTNNEQLTTDKGQTPRSTAKVWTLQQESIAREFEQYSIERRQISFDGEREEPIFDFDALSILSLALSDIPEISVEPGDFNNAAGIATANARITIADGRVRTMYGNCLVGELMFDGTEVSDISQALKIAQARALRNGLRAVGFDPIRAHLQAKTQEQQPNVFTDVRSTELAEAHLLGTELGYIFRDGHGDNKDAWKNMIRSYFPPHTSSGDLNELQRSQLLSMLRSWKTARSRATAESSAVKKLLTNT